MTAFYIRGYFVSSVPCVSCKGKSVQIFIAQNQPLGMLIQNFVLSIVILFFTLSLLGLFHSIRTGFSQN